MAHKFYTRFQADLGAMRPCEYSGIVELRAEESRPADVRHAASLIARDLKIDADAIRVLEWTAMH
jgi:hypothetical protein